MVRSTLKAWSTMYNCEDPSAWSRHQRAGITRREFLKPDHLRMQIERVDLPKGVAFNAP